MSRVNNIMKGLKQQLKKYGYNAAQPRAADGKWATGHDQAGFHLTAAEGLKNGNAKRRHIATALAARATQLIKDGSDASRPISQLGQVVESLRLQVHHAKTGKKAGSQAQIDERQAAYDHYRGLLNQVKAHAAGKGPAADVTHFAGALDDADSKSKTAAPVKKPAPKLTAPVTPAAPPQPAAPVQTPAPTAAEAPLAQPAPQTAADAFHPDLSVEESKAKANQFMQQHTTKTLRNDTAGAEEAMHLSMGHHWAAVAQQAAMDGKLDKAKGAATMVEQHVDALFNGSTKNANPDVNELNKKAHYVGEGIQALETAANPSTANPPAAQHTAQAPAPQTAAPAPAPQHVAQALGSAFDHAAESNKAEQLWKDTIHDSSQNGINTHWAAVNLDSAHGALAHAGAGMGTLVNLKNASGHIDKAAQHILSMTQGGDAHQGEAAHSYIKAMIGYEALAAQHGAPPLSIKAKDAASQAAKVMLAAPAAPAEPLPVDMTADDHFGKYDELDKAAQKIQNTAPATAAMMEKQGLMHMKLAQIKTNQSNGLHGSNKLNIKIANDVYDELEKSAPDGIAHPLKAALDSVTAIHDAATGTPVTPPTAPAAPAAGKKWQGWGRYGITPDQHDQAGKAALDQSANTAPGHVDKKLLQGAAAIHLAMEEAKVAMQSGAPQSEVEDALKPIKGIMFKLKGEVADPTASPEALGHLKLAAGAFNALKDAHPELAGGKAFMGPQLLTATAYKPLNPATGTNTLPPLSTPAAASPVDHQAEANYTDNIAYMLPDGNEKTALNSLSNAHLLMHEISHGMGTDPDDVNDAISSATDAIGDVDEHDPHAKEIASSYLKLMQGQAALHQAHGFAPKNLQAVGAEKYAQSIMNNGNGPNVTQGFDHTAAHDQAEALSDKHNANGLNNAAASESAYWLKTYHDLAQGGGGTLDAHKLDLAGSTASMADFQDPEVGKLFTDTVDNHMAQGGDALAPSTMNVYNNIKNPGSGGFNHQAASAAAEKTKQDAATFEGVNSPAYMAAKFLGYHHDDEAKGGDTSDWLSDSASHVVDAVKTHPELGTMFQNAVEEQKAKGNPIEPQVSHAYNALMQSGAVKPVSTNSASTNSGQEISSVPGAGPVDTSIPINPDNKKQEQAMQSMYSSLASSSASGIGWLPEAHSKLADAYGNLSISPSESIKNLADAKSAVVSHLQYGHGTAHPAFQSALANIANLEKIQAGKATNAPAPAPSQFTPPAPAQFTPTPAPSGPISFSIGAPKADNGMSGVQGYGKLPKAPKTFAPDFSATSYGQHKKAYKAADKADKNLSDAHKALTNAYAVENKMQGKDKVMAYVAQAKEALAQYGSDKGASVPLALHSIDHFEKKYGAITHTGLTAAPKVAPGMSSVPGAGKLPAAGGSFKPLSAWTMMKHHGTMSGSAMSKGMPDLAKAHQAVRAAYNGMGPGGDVYPSSIADVTTNIAKAKASLAQHIADYGVKGPGISNALLGIDHIEKALAKAGQAPVQVATPAKNPNAPALTPSTPYVKPVQHAGVNHTSNGPSTVSFQTTHHGKQNVTVSQGAGPSQAQANPNFNPVLSTASAKAVIQPAIKSLSPGNPGAILGKTGANALPPVPVNPATMPTLVHTTPVKTPGKLDTIDHNTAVYGPATTLGGSNGAKAYTGKDGVKRAVKTYATGGSTQAYGEHITNKVYEALGIPVAKTHLSDTGSELAHVSEMLPDTAKPVGTSVSKDDAQEIMKGFAADVLLGNRDAVGSGGDNIKKTVDGKLVRIDNGGSLLHRAMGTRKSDADLSDLGELETLKTKNADHARVFQAAGIDNWKDIPGLPDQIKRASAALTDDHIDKLVTSMPHVPEADRQKIISTLKIRRDKLVAQIPVIEAHQKAQAAAKAAKYAVDKKVYDSAVAAVASGQNPSDTLKQKIDTGAQIIHHLAATGQLPHHKEALEYVQSQGGVVKAAANGAPDISSGSAVQASYNALSSRGIYGSGGVTDSTKDKVADFAQNMKLAVITNQPIAAFRSMVTAGKAQTCFHGVASKGSDNNNLNKRASVEAGGFKLWNPHDGADRSPVYGEFSPAIDHNPPPPFKLTHNSSYGGYGASVALELHPHVADRTQYHVGDSLYSGLSTQQGKLDPHVMNKHEAQVIKAAAAAANSSSSMEAVIGGGVTMEDVRAVRVVHDNLASGKVEADKLRAHLDNNGYHHLPIYIHETGTAGGDTIHYHSGTPM